ncbi:BTAD domain-containing putative transcriptional regulator [Lentzea sp. NPDC051213]|uniref:AfsR/SARP family transcriptional regulator n=1 Tax=Lentzea sp. NPDC051213 TaxID=3364126 RepID=UPI0037A5E8E7
MQFRVLGPLEVRIDGTLVEFGGPKPRRLLVALLSHANNTVSVTRLLDWLWPDRSPPPSAVAILQAHVSRLRRVLEPDRACWGAPRLLLTRASGYLLSVGVDQLDVLHFEREVAHGRELLLRGDFTAAATTLSGALALWRGPALMELDGVPALRACVVRWEAMRHFAIIMRIEADLELGNHLVVIPELEYLAATHPFDERVHGLLMVALYRCHRRADTLAVYERLSADLRRELDTEPTTALRRLRYAVLTHEPALDSLCIRRWL